LFILGIDSNLSDDFGRTIAFGISAVTTITTIGYLGGLPSFLAMFVLGIVYWNGRK
jgi:hypothetical protein